MITIDGSELKEISRKIRRLGARVGLKSARRSLIREVRDFEVNSTTRRIIATKTAPSGARWKAWSPGYAATRDTGVHSILRDTENLLLGVKGSIAGDTVHIFSDVDYSGHVQAERPFLGLSTSDTQGIRNILGVWLDKQVDVAT